MGINIKSLHFSHNSNALEGVDYSKKIAEDDLDLTFSDDADGMM